MNLFMCLARSPFLKKFVCDQFSIGVATEFLYAIPCQKTFRCQGNPIMQCWISIPFPSCVTFGRTKPSWKWKINKGTESELWSQEQARKALESALSGKKNELEKWDKEIKRREELGGGGDTGGGGWFGWNRWFGWSNDDNFWQEAKQAILTILGIVLMVRRSCFHFQFFCWYIHKS